MVKKISGEKPLDPCVLCKHLPNYDEAMVNDIVKDIKINRQQYINLNIVSSTNAAGERESHATLKVEGNAKTLVLMDKVRLTEEFLRDIIIAYAKYAKRSQRHVENLLAHAQSNHDSLSKIHNEMRFM